MADGCDRVMWGKDGEDDRREGCVLVKISEWPVGVPRRRTGDEELW